MSTRIILVWAKCPSVTTGGKDYFYVAHLDTGRMARIVWDRRVRAYKLTIDSTNGNPPFLLGFYTSHRRAMKIAQEWIAR